MPKVAIFFFALLLSVVITNSYAFNSGDLIQEDLKTQHPFIYDSQILEIPEIFIENNFKRYLIFGTNTQNNNFLQRYFIVWNSI